MLVLGLGIMMHMAPRWLRTYNYIPGFVLPRNGIIVGCSQSTAFARILLHGMLSSIHDTPWFGHVTIRSFVDDIRHTARGKGERIVEKMRDTAVLLAHRLKGIKCKISTKSVCLSNRKALKEAIVRTLKYQGVVVTQVHRAPHLGVEAGGGHRRTTGIIRSRYGGTKERANRAAWPTKRKIRGPGHCMAREYTHRPHMGEKPADSTRKWSAVSVRWEQMSWEHPNMADVPLRRLPWEKA